MATLSVTDIVFNSDLETSTVNSIFAEIENFLNGTTASADITITGTMTADQFQTAADGSSIGSGAYIMGAGDDAGLYWDATDIVLEASSALTNTPQYLNFKHTTSGTPAAGIGVGLKATVETSAGNNEIGGYLEFITTDVTSTSEDFDLVIKLMTAGAAAAEVARFQSDGKLDLVSGAEYQINGTDVLSATALGSGVVSSSLTSVGTLTSLTVSGDATFDTNTLFVDASENKVGIGTASPNTAELHIQNQGAGTTHNANAALRLQSASAGKTSTIQFTDGATATYISAISGDLSFGASSALMTIDSSGIVRVPNCYGHDMNGETYRDLLINSSGELGYDSSTIRKKTNVTDMEDISWIYDLRPVNFEYKAKDNADEYTDSGNGQKEYGLIAEEVISINNRLVFHNILEDGTKEVEGVQYRIFIPILLKAIQDQKKEIDQLKLSS